MPTEKQHAWKRGNHLESELDQGNYREWFWRGLDDDQRAFLRAPVIVPSPPEPDNFLITWDGSQVRGWWRKSACAGADPSVFFVGEGEAPKAAYAKPDAPWRDYCPQCPVRESCLQAARESESVGIWGGKLRLQRKSSSSFSNIDEFDDSNIGPARGRGRPRTNTKTGAQRSKEYRDRIRAAKAREPLGSE